jgi:hypothetical protein
VNKYLWLIVFMLCLGAEGGHKPYSVVTLEDDVIVSVGLPDWGTVCAPAIVRGGPGENYPEMYSIGVGTHVRIHDQSMPDGNWVSIKAARWIPLDSVCW